MAADNIVRNRLADELVLDQPGLRVCPVQHREIFVGKRMILSHFPVNILRDKGSFIRRAAERPEMNKAPRPFFRPQLFVFTMRVVADDGIRRIQNVLGGTVILFELDDKCVRILCFKIQDIADIGAAELVDRLVIVADNAQIPIAAGKHAHDVKLHLVGILILIHHNIAEPVLIRLQNLPVCPEQFSCFQ